MKKTHPRSSARPARAVAASPAVAGYRPLALAAAVAAVFGVVPQVRAQPTGTQAIHGTVTQQQQGNTTTLWTTNGAGTSHSVLNHTGFSVPAGTVTNIMQPSAASMSINRVVGNNPSQIYGTLSSNGKVVLVNPAGIAVGAGAVVDTAGFTASTLRMSDADALAGRLVFGDGTGGGALSVSGKILARSGDVVLISPDVRVGSEALVQAPNGATIVAAGQKVALTGRGLEGIQLELQAGDQALNLGRLEGDAVGIFAGQLKHSGAIQATAVSVEGGKVVLKGGHSAEISGTVTASKGTVGGQVHATANQVMLKSGAIIDVSGRQGGGEALIGGGWQGQDSRIQNAQATTIEAGATIKADATHNGDGGTIVAWSDGATAVAGHLSARGGAEGGNGGRIETSGKHLAMSATADTRAPNGATGTLLLDPTNIYIASSLANATAAGMAGSNQTSGGPNFTPAGTVNDSLVLVSDIQSYLAGNNVMIQTTNASGGGNGDIRVVDGIAWASTNELGLQAERHIAVNGTISAANGALVLKAGTGGSGDISQTAAISVSKLVAYAQNGSVTLTNSGNSVGTLAGFSNSAAGFNFVAGGNVNVNSITSANAMGVFNGVRAGLGTADISVTGTLTVTDSGYGVTADSGAVNLQGAAFTQAASGVVNGTSIKLQADSFSLGGLSNTIVATGGIAIENKSAGRKIELGNGGVLGEIDLNATELATLNAGGVLRIGTTNAGNLQVKGAISVTANTLSLKSGGSIGQDAGATITANQLAVEALATSYLNQANSVTGFAGRVGGAGFVNQNIGFTNAGTFQVRSLDSISGVSVNNISGTYSSAAPDGVIILKAQGTGSLHQAGGALIAGKAIYAEGGQVDMTGANPTGVIAGQTTGALAGGIFTYTSASGISVSSVNSFAGITQNNASPGTITLNGTSVSQESSAPVVTTGWLHANASSGSVNLDTSGNNAGSFAATAATGITVHNSGNLTLGNLVTSTGSIDAHGNGSLTVLQGASAASGIRIAAEGASGDVTVSTGTLNAGSGGVTLSSNGGNVQFTGTVGVAGGSAANLQAAAGEVRVSSGVTTLKSDVTSSTNNYLKLVGGQLNVASNVTVQRMALAGGSITGSGNLGIGTHFTGTSGSMSGSGTFGIMSGGWANITGGLSVTRPMVNNGAIYLQGSGSLGVGTGFALANNGIFQIENDGGIVGGTGTVVNSGVFRKGLDTAAATESVTGAVASVSTTPSVINVGSFVNNGTLEINEKTLNFTSGVFTTNSGTILLQGGAKLDSVSTNLTNAGMIKGTGFIALGGGATLNNTGHLAPGGAGSLGALGIDGNLHLQSGSVVNMDVFSPTSYDKIYTTGNVNVAAGATGTVNLSAATGLSVGNTFDFVQSSGGTIAGTVPTPQRFKVEFLTAPSVLRATLLELVGTTSAGQSISQVLPGTTTALINAVLAEQSNVLEEPAALVDDKKEAEGAPAVVNETSCKPA